MIRAIFTITRLYLRMLLSEPSTLVFMLALPLLFTFILGLVTGQGEHAAALPRVQVVNQDRGGLGQAFVAQLQKQAELVIIPAAQVATLAAMEADKVVAVLVVPPTFSQQVAQGATPTLDLRTSTQQMPQLPLIEQALQAGSARFMGAQRAAHLVDNVTQASLPAGKPIMVAERLFTNEQATEHQRPLVEFTQFTPTAQSGTPSKVTPNGLDQSSPGMLVMFALFFMLGGSTVLIEEREAGTLRRLVTAPISKTSLLLGKLLGIFSAGLLQMTILIGAGALLFGVNWGHAPVALALLMVSFALAVTSLGMLIAALVRTTTQASALSTILVYGMSALGGAWWPLAITPGWMQQLAHLFPTYWGMAGFQTIILQHLGTVNLSAVTLEVSVLCGFAALFLTVGIWRFRYE